MSGSVIVAGARTPIGRLLGGLKDQSAADLGGVAIKGALDKAGVAPQDVDYVIMGAGVPRDLPRLLTEFAEGRTGHLTIDVAGATKVHRASLDPVTYLGSDLPKLRRPRFLAIVSVHVLATYLNKDPEIRPDGFVVEGPRAGGHSAPPRGKMVLDEDGEPVYGPRDDADLAKVAETGLPFWLAGAYTTPEKVAEALAAGAAGVQIGTLFAMAAGLVWGLVFVAPTLLVQGGADAFVPETDTQRLLQRLPRARASVWAGAGHAMHWEDPVRFAAELVRFVNA